MTLQIEIGASEEMALRRRAEANGQDLAAYAAELLRRVAIFPARSLDQIARDIEQRRGAPLDMDEDELSECLEAAKHQMRSERHGRTGK
jgi:hypothetical protein